MNETRPPLAKLATDLLATEEPTRAPPAGADRDAAIARIAAEIQRTATRRRHTRAAIVVGSIVAVAAAALVVVRASHPRASPHEERAVVTGPASPTVSAVAVAGEISIVHGETSSRLVDEPTTIDVGDRVVTAVAARGVLSLSTGTRIVVEEGSDVALVERDATEMFTLRAGSMQADVAKLKEGERFVVRTVDGEVEVRGTSFHVAIVAGEASCRGGARTRVAVEEGVVEVRVGGSTDRVARGESWPRECSTSIAAAPSLAAPSCGSTTAATTPTTVSKAASTTTPPPVAPPSAKPSSDGAAIAMAKRSDLAAQNDVFADAVTKKRSGDLVGALATFERFLSKWPGASLSESAAVERMRILASLDAGKGAAAARAYLATHPKGFAREEAEALVAGAH